MRFSYGLHRLRSDLLQHPWLSFLSIITLMVTLLILGLFFLFFRNFGKIISHSKQEIHGVVYLKSSLSVEEITKIKNQIKLLPKVAGVDYKSKKEIFSNLKNFFGYSFPSTPFPSLEEIEESFFSDLLELRFTEKVSQSALNQIEEELKMIPVVSHVDLSQDWIQKVKKLQGIVQSIGVILAVILLMGCCFIVGNMTSLRNQNRKSEMELEALLGADQKFLFSPFFLSAVGEGFLGAILAILTLAFLTKIFTTLYLAHWVHFLGIKEISFLSGYDIFSIFFIGISMAIVGSLSIFIRSKHFPVTEQ